MYIEFDLPYIYIFSIHIYIAILHCTTTHSDSALYMYIYVVILHCAPVFPNQLLSDINTCNK